MTKRAHNNGQNVFKLANVTPAPSIRNNTGALVDGQGYLKVDELTYLRAGRVNKLINIDFNTGDKPRRREPLPFVFWGYVNKPAQHLDAPPGRDPRDFAKVSVIEFLHYQ